MLKQCIAANGDRRWMDGVFSSSWRQRLFRGTGCCTLPATPQPDQKSPSVPSQNERLRSRGAAIHLLSSAELRSFAPYSFFLAIYLFMNVLQIWRLSWIGRRTFYDLLHLLSMVSSTATVHGEPAGNIRTSPRPCSPARCARYIHKLYVRHTNTPGT